MTGKAEASPLEIATLKVVGLYGAFGSEVFGEPMLARALRTIADADAPVSPEFRAALLTALADALAGSDKLCDVKVSRRGKRGPKGASHGSLCSQRAIDTARYVDKLEADGVGVESTIAAIAQRDGLSRATVFNDLQEGRAAIRKIRKYRDSRHRD